MRIVLTLLFLINYAFATNYYVRTDGSNSNTGTTNTAGGAWLTLYYAVTHTTSGDIIHMGSGTFTETQQCPLPVGVSIEGVDSSSTIIKSTQTGFWDAIIFAGSGTEGTDGNQHISNLKMDGNGATTQVGIVFAGRKNCSVYNCSFVNFYRNACTFTGRVTGSWLVAGAPTTYATGNSFYNNRVDNCSVYVIAEGYGSGCVQFGGQDGFLCYNNWIRQLTRGNGAKEIGWPLKMACEGWIKNCKIYNDTLIKEPWTGNQGQDDGWNFVSEFWNYSGLEVYNNFMQGTFDLAHGGSINGNSTLNTSEYSIYFHNNHVKSPSINTHYENGLYLEIEHYDVWVENNIFENVATGVSSTAHDFVGDGSGKQLVRYRIRNNLFKNIGGGGGQSFGIKLYIDESSGDAHDWLIDNNTFIANTGDGFIGINLPSFSGSTTKNIRVRNNVVYGFTLAGIYAGDQANYNGLYIQNNSFYNNLTNISLNGTGSPTNYTNSGNITTNPNLDASYHPNVGSPCIDAGINVGLPYNNGIPDIGYFETGTNSSTIPTVSSFTATSGAAGESIVITGTNFTDATAVYFGLYPAASFTINSSTQITATVGTGLTGRVYVTNPAGIGDKTGFTFIPPPAPAITSFTASSGSHGSSVVITGTDFNNITAVSFGLISAASFTVNSSTQITAVPDIGATGYIRVTGDDGTGTSATKWTYNVGCTTLAQNLLKHSSSMTNAVYSYNSVAATNDQATNDITGTATMDELVVQSGTSNYFGQDVTISPSTTYYFSFDIKNSTISDWIPNVYDAANFTNFFVSLNRIENISTTTTRVQYKFTTASNSSTINVQPISHCITTGIVYVDRLQLTTNPDYQYIATTTAAVSTPQAAAACPTSGSTPSILILKGWKKRIIFRH